MAFYNSELFESKPELLNGNLQIIACAGSGKTEFVSERIAYQIFKGIAKPDQIIAFTFTNRAADELKFRVRAKIKELMGKQPDIGDMYIGTIHAFAFKFLQEYVPKYRGFDMLDEVKRLAFISTMKKEIHVRTLTNDLLTRFPRPFHINPENWLFNAFISDIDLLREEGLTEDDILSDNFRKASQVYFNKLEEKRFLDFSGVLRLAVDTLEKQPAIRQKVQDKFKFFTVDEYQDINPIQEKLIQLISNKENVCVVGDDDQSIYQWRGADVQNIITFQQRYTEVAVHRLDINRRSCDAIVKTSDELIAKNNPYRLEKNIKDKGLKSESGDLYKLLFERQEFEIVWIITKIKSLLGTEFLDGTQIRKLKYSDFAILFRSVLREATPYIEALKAANIPVVFAGTGGLFDTDEVSAVIKIFEYISECDKDVVYNSDLLKIMHANLPKEFSLSFEEYKARILKIQHLENKHSSISLQALYVKILIALGVSDVNFHNAEDDILLFNLGRLSRMISDYEEARECFYFYQIKEFIWFVRHHCEKYYDSGDTDARSGLIDAVQVMTMHGTKGLGFPVVFMPSHFGQNSVEVFGPTFLDVTKFDSTRFINTPEDERRLYYVALTRSKKYLFVTSASYKIKGKVRAPHSNFFNEIPDEHFIYMDIPDPTKRKLCDIDGIVDELRFPTSYSDLSCYLKCGYDYKMRHIFNFNAQLIPALGFGQQVHNIINLLHRDFENTGQIPTSTQINKVINEHFYLRYASDTILGNMKANAIKSITRYVQIWEKDFSLTVQTERPYEYEFENALINGRIDMIKRENENESVLEIIDYKTGKPKDELMRKYELQVQLYTIAVQEALGMNIQSASIHFIDSDQNERISINTSSMALESAKDEVRSALKGITKSTFKRDALHDRICTSCDWSKMCPKREGWGR
ncbi:MAG: ATP-dependent DNA helicase [bacterium]